MRCCKQSSQLSFRRLVLLDLCFGLDLLLAIVTVPQCVFHSQRAANNIVITSLLITAFKKRVIIYGNSAIVYNCVVTNQWLKV